MREVWKDVVGYEGYYQISNFGRVRSLDRLTRSSTNLEYKGTMRGRVLKPIDNNKGYFMVALAKNGSAKWKLISRLVAKAFIPNPNNYPIVNHKNEIKKDNVVDNLEWCTQKYNVNYGIGNETNTQLKYKKVKMLTESGDFIKTFDSVQEASENTGIFSTNICRAIRKKYRTTKKGKTYRWSY